MKKNFKTIIISLLTSLFLIPTVHADLIPPILKDALRDWFGGAIPEDYVIRMLLGLLLFIVFYWAAGAVFTSGRFGETQTSKFRWMIALIIAIITVVFIPPSLLEAYKQIFSMITPILLTVGLIFLIRKITKSHTSEGYIGAAIACAFMVGIMGVMLALTDTLGIGFRVVSGWTFTDILQLIMIGFLIATAFYIAKAFGKGGGLGLGLGGGGGDIGPNIKERRKTRGEKKLESAEAKKMGHEADLIKKDLKREAKGFKDLWKFLDKEKKAIGDLKKHLLKIKEAINLVQRLRSDTSMDDNKRKSLVDAKQRILDELGTLLPIIDKERKIDEKIERVTNKIQKLEKRNFRLEWKEKKQADHEEDLINKIKGMRGKYKESELNMEAIEKYVKEIIAEEKYIFQKTTRIKKIEKVFNNLTNQIAQAIKNGSLQVTNNNFPQAVSLIGEAINLLEEQDKLIVEIERIEQRIIQIARREFNIEGLISKTGKKEASGTKKEIKKEEGEEKKIKKSGGLGPEDIGYGYHIK